MDFDKLNSIKFDTSSNNTTFTSLPSTILEALIPGYGIFSSIIFRVFGFDVGLVVSGCLVIYGLAIGGQFLYYRANNLFSSYLMSCIQIDDDDRLFSQIMEWIAQQRMTKRSRSLKAVTKWVSAWYESDEERNANDDDVLDESGIFNFEKWASNIPPRYEPNFGSDRFWYQGRLFIFSRVRRERQVRSFWGNGDDEFLDISCIGRSTEPIKELLNHIKSWSLTKDNNMTAIYRPSSKEDRKDFSWDMQSLRPSRPMSTVSLDVHQKASIVQDVNEYLHPASARWYAARGIPYRRGYLFHGKPGTGKSSLSFALAGIFGLDIYCISLMEIGLTESELNKLFADLPRRCILLLEDIDSAGLRRPDEPETKKDKGDDSSDDSSDDGSLTKINKAEVKTTATQVQAAAGGIKSLISLSGLLNAIDGVASHEGRVLIMTTNCPEKLDAALLRPGRVDLQVQFTLATYEQIRDIFKRMYSSDAETPKSKSSKSAKTLSKPGALPTPPSSRPSSSHSSSSAKPNPRAGEDEEFLQLLRNKPILDVVDAEKLQEMAEEFASQIPPDTFSPAEIQGYLLTRKKEPRRALTELAKWRDGLLEAKTKERKVVDVQ